MRVRLRGINRVRKRLANGSVREYHYAWKGGPPLTGKPGSPEFIASFNEAAKRKVPVSEAALLSILIGFQSSGEFTGLAERTQRDYAKSIKIIEVEFADFPLAALSDKGSKGVFLEWRDALAKKSLRQADYHFVVLARILAWALKRGYVDANPCTKPGRLYHGTRVDKVWTDEDEAAFYRVAPHRLHLPLLLALWTGQRQGDLLSLSWSAYDGDTIRWRQSKGGRRVVIPVGAPLRAALDATERQSPIILVNAKRRPWTTEGTFSAEFRKACKRAGIVDRTFHDLRGTAVTRLALVDCSEAEIATLTGHSLRGVRAILDAHYLHRDPQLAENAIRKLESRTENAQLSAQPSSIGQGGKAR